MQTYKTGLKNGRGVGRLGGEDRIPAYSIGVVRQMTGLSERQIRYYDEKGLVIPARTPGGKRLYSSDDVKLLVKIKGYLEKGLTIKEVRQELEASRRRREALLQGLNESDVEHRFPERKVLREGIHRSRPPKGQL